MTTVTPPRSRRERKKQATRRRIVEAATRLFAEHGFDAPTVDQIAEEADVAKGTIYNYFDAKEELLFELLIEVERQVQGELDRFAEAPGPLESILEEWLRHQFRLKRPHLPFVRVFLSQLVLRADELEEHTARVQHHMGPPLMALLERLKERGLIPGEADVGRVAEEVMYLHFGLSCLWAMEGPPFTMTDQALTTQVTAFARAVERGFS
jgi:AcrR family transcriptional regulator